MWAADTHCHLDRYSNPSSIARKASEAGVFIVAVTNLPSHFFLGLPHTKSLQGVRLAVGFHPMVAAQHPNEFADFRRAISLTSFVGEIGLDMSAEGRPSADAQIQLLGQILPSLVDRPRFITFHSRGAERELLKMLRDAGLRGAVMHWYSGPVGLIDDFLADGHYFSINPAMVDGTSGRRIVTAIPKERVLTETDGPHTRCGRRASFPTDVGYVINGIAGMWGVAPSEAAAITCRNFRSLISTIES